MALGRVCPVRDEVRPLQALPGPAAANCRFASISCLGRPLQLSVYPLCITAQFRACVHKPTLVHNLTYIQLPGWKWGTDVLDLD